MAAHYFSAWYTKNYLFPKVTGWDPYHYLGFPQNQFYPPLYTILTVLLSYLLGLQLSFKVILSISIILTPLSFYYFARSFKFNEIKSSIIMLGMFSFMFINKNFASGGDVFSSFNSGLVSNALALPILFFYLGSFKKSIEKNSYLTPSLLLALVILAHVFTAVAGLIFSFSILATKLNKKKSILYIKHLALSFALGAFWILPFLLKINYAKTIFIPGFFYFKFWWISLYIFIIFIVLKSLKNKEMRSLNLSLLLFLIFYMVISVNKLTIHLYRFNFYIILLIPVFMVSFIKNKSNLKFLVIIFCFIIIVNYPSLQLKGTADINIAKLEKLDGRIIVLGPREQPGSVLTKETVIPMVSKNLLIEGPYIDSSLNAWVIGDMFKTIYEKTFYPFDPEFSNRNLSDKEKWHIIPNQTSLLNINYMIATEDVNYINKKLLKRNIVIHDGVNYSLYKISNSSLIEILPYKPQVVKENWDKIVKNWFYSSNISNILVNSEVPDYIGKGNEKVEVIYISENQEYIKFKVNSNTPVPILIKISEFPNWHAYSSGKPLRIYRASPYLMLVYGKGVIELKYEYTFWDYAGAFLTLISLFFVITSVLISRKIKTTQ